MAILRYGLVGLGLIVGSLALFTQIYAWWIEKTYPPTGRFVDVTGGRLHYREAGPADGGRGTIVLLHGASSNLEEAMLGLGNRLSEHYRVVAVDRPGHGWSDRIDGSAAARPDRQAAILAEGLGRIGVHGAVVVGHSWSGSILPNLALDHREVTAAILDMSGATHPWPGGKVDWYYSMATSWVGWLFTRTITTPVGLVLFRTAVSSSFQPQAMPADFPEKARLPLIFRPHVFDANAQDVAGLYRAVEEQSPRYAQIRVPTTIIGGDADTIVWTNLHSRAFAAAVPGARLIILPGIGHMPQYAEPDLVIREIEALAEKVAPVPAAAALKGP
jgi:pimeloyl-ACP methyl ester carboxylesterase